MLLVHFTATEVQKAKPSSTPYLVFVGKGLCLQVAPPKKYWRFRRRKSHRFPVATFSFSCCLSPATAHGRCNRFSYAPRCTQIRVRYAATAFFRANSSPDLFYHSPVGWKICYPLLPATLVMKQKQPMTTTAPPDVPSLHPYLPSVEHSCRRSAAHHPAYL